MTNTIWIDAASASVCERKHQPKNNHSSTACQLSVCIVKICKFGITGNTHRKQQSIMYTNKRRRQINFNYNNNDNSVSCLNGNGNGTTKCVQHKNCKGLTNEVRTPWSHTHSYIHTYIIAYTKAVQFDDGFAQNCMHQSRWIECIYSVVDCKIDYYRRVDDTHDRSGRGRAFLLYFLLFVTSAQSETGTLHVNPHIHIHTHTQTHRECEI